MRFADLMCYRIGDNWVGQCRDNNQDWSLVEGLFDKHYPNTDHLPNKIPKKIHQIWLVGEIPAKYDRLRQTWRDCHPDWEYNSGQTLIYQLLVCETATNSTAQETSVENLTSYATRFYTDTAASTVYKTARRPLIS